MFMENVIDSFSEYFIKNLIRRVFSNLKSVLFSYYSRRERYIWRKLYLHARGKETIKAPIHRNDCVEGLFELVSRPRQEVNGKTYQFVG